MSETTTPPARSCSRPGTRTGVQTSAVRAFTSMSQPNSIGAPARFWPVACAAVKSSISSTPGTERRSTSACASRQYPNERARSATSSASLTSRMSCSSWSSDAVERSAAIASASPGTSDATPRRPAGATASAAATSFGSEREVEAEPAAAVRHDRIGLGALAGRLDLVGGHHERAPAVPIDDERHRARVVAAVAREVRAVRGADQDRATRVEGSKALLQAFETVHGCELRSIGHGADSTARRCPSGAHDDGERPRRRARCRHVQRDDQATASAQRRARRGVEPDAEREGARGRRDGAQAPDADRGPRPGPSGPALRAGPSGRR